MSKTNPDELVFTTNMYYGISKREYFAALAMQASNMEAYADTFGTEWAEHVAKDSVTMADALIKALNEGGEK